MPPLHIGHTKIPGSTMFPNGSVPEALGASVTLQSSSEPMSSDSDNGGMQLLLGDLFFSLAMLIKPQAVSANWESLATAAGHERLSPELRKAMLTLSIFDAYPAESIDEWIRQVFSLPHGSPSNIDGMSQ
jgi:hypothetical protein